MSLTVSFVLMFTVISTTSFQYNENCIKQKSLHTCEKCTSSEQCNEGYCCPYMKKCVKTSQTPCPYPIAECNPPCHSVEPHQCKCKNKDFPEKWKTCKGKFQ